MSPEVTDDRIAQVIGALCTETNLGKLTWLLEPPHALIGLRFVRS